MCMYASTSIGSIFLSPQTPTKIEHFFLDTHTPPSPEKKKTVEKLAVLINGFFHSVTVKFGPLLKIHYDDKNLIFSSTS